LAHEDEFIGDEAKENEAEEAVDEAVEAKE
jgi:hypothetical protein